MNNSEAEDSYLRSLKAGRGLPSKREEDCLERIKLWEGLIAWCEEMESAEIEAEVGRPDAGPSGTVSSFSDPSGTPALNIAKTGRKPKKGVWDPKTMSKAVARDLGLI